MEFRHTSSGIIYIGNTSMSVDEFRGLEPDYPLLPDDYFGLEYFQVRHVRHPDGKFWAYGRMGNPLKPRISAETLDAYIGKEESYRTSLSLGPPQVRVERVP